LRCPKRSLTAGPLHLAEKVHARMRSIPLRVPHLLSAVRPDGRTSSPWVLLPTTAPLALAPCEAGFHPHLGSALRFSQPLSGFLASSSFVALFHATAVPGIPPSESSPRKNRAPLSRPLCSHVVIHRVLKRSRSVLIAAGFLDSHALTQLPDSSRRLSAPFSRPRRDASR